MPEVQEAQLFPLTAHVQSLASLLHTQGKSLRAAQEHGTRVGCPSLSAATAAEESKHCFQGIFLKKRGPGLPLPHSREMLVKFPVQTG